MNRYEAACAAHAANYPAFLAAKDAYRAGKISDAAYCAAFRINEDLKAAVDAAERSLSKGADVILIPAAFL